MKRIVVNDNDHTHALPPSSPPLPFWVALHISSSRCTWQLWILSPCNVWLPYNTVESIWISYGGHADQIKMVVLCRTCCKSPHLQPHCYMPSLRAQLLLPRDKWVWLFLLSHNVLKMQRLTPKSRGSPMVSGVLPRFWEWPIRLTASFSFILKASLVCCLYKHITVSILLVKFILHFAALIDAKL